MRYNVRVEPIAGSDVGNPSGLGQLVGFLEVFGYRPRRQLFEDINRVPINAQVGAHSRLQHLVSLAFESFPWLHRSMAILGRHFRFLVRLTRFYRRTPDTTTGDRVETRLAVCPGLRRQLAP